MKTVSSETHILLIPSYNTGSERLRQVVLSALQIWQPVLVVIDGSTDGSEIPLQAIAKENDALKVIIKSTNQGKGSAVLEGIRYAAANGFSHALTMDADGQHPINRIQTFMTLSKDYPDAMILGAPVFDQNVPLERLQGRKLSVWLAHFETLGRRIGDPLFGFRVYPIVPLLAVLEKNRFARGFDFDPEVVVRLFWKGVRPINRKAPVRYFSKAEGVSHFNYLRDNLLLIWLHMRLITTQLLTQLPACIRYNQQWKALEAENPVSEKIVYPERATP